MPRKCVSEPWGLSAERPVASSVEDDRFRPFPDWWRQIDRWVNEGGADERTTPEREHESRALEP